MKTLILTICLTIVCCQLVYSTPISDSEFSKRQQIIAHKHNYGQSYYINHANPTNPQVLNFNSVTGTPLYNYESLQNIEQNMRDKILSQVNHKDIHYGDTIYNDYGQNSNNNQIMKPINTGCDCNNFICRCCQLIDSISKTPKCFEFEFLNKNGEFQVKQDKQIIGKNTVQLMSDICDADQTFCIHFYDIKVEPGMSIIGCSDLRIKNGNITVKIGCFNMNSDFNQNTMIGNKETFQSNFVGNNFVGSNFENDKTSYNNNYMGNTYNSNKETFQSNFVGNNFVGSKFENDKTYYNKNFNGGTFDGNKSFYNSNFNGGVFAGK